MERLNIFDKEKIQLLTEPNDLVAFMHIFLRVSVEFLLFTMSIVTFKESWVVSFFFVYICAIWHSFWGYAGIGHEFYHGRVFKAKIINIFFFRISSYLTLNNSEFFKRSHGYHHVSTFAEDDAEANSVQSWSYWSIVAYNTVDFILLFRRLSYLVINSFGYVASQSGFKRLQRTVQRESIYMFLFQLLMHFLIFFVYENVVANIVWLMLPFTAQFINRLLAQSQHIGLKLFKKSGPLMHSRTIELPWLLEFLYAGMNYHSEHHLFPLVPYYNLKKVNKCLVEKRLIKSIDWKVFFFHEIWILISQNKSNQSLVV